MPSEKRYVNPRTGEVIDNPVIRPFKDILLELGEGSTHSEMSNAFWELLQRVQDTGKAGSLTLQISPRPQPARDPGRHSHQPRGQLIMTDTIDVKAIIDIAQQSIETQPLEDGQIYAIRNEEGGIELLETPGYCARTLREELQAAPARIARRVTLRDAASLVDYLGRNTDAHELKEVVDTGYRHGIGELELWADLDDRRIVAILDGVDGNREHLAVLELRHSREWDEWTEVDGKLLPQVQFAQFIEDHISSIGAPDGGTLLDVVQTLTAKTKVDFKSSSLLSNGQRQFEFAETVEAKAGQKGNLAIPAELTLVLYPFQGSEAVAVVARFRYRLDDGQLLLGVRLAEPERALEAAFEQVVTEIQGAVPVRINHGVG